MSEDRDLQALKALSDAATPGLWHGYDGRAGMTGDPELPNENMELLARLDSWKAGTNPGPIIRWAAAHLRGCIALPPPETTLDEAWTAAEKALPGPDWLLEVVRRGAVKGDINPWTGYPVLSPTERYTATAGQAWNGGPSWKRLDPPQHEAEGPTPAAALQALVRVMVADRIGRA